MPVTRSSAIAVSTLSDMVFFGISASNDGSRPEGAAEAAIEAVVNAADGSRSAVEGLSLAQAESVRVRKIATTARIFTSFPQYLNAISGIARPADPVVCNHSPLTRFGPDFPRIHHR